MKYSLDRQLPNGFISLDVLHSVENRQPQEIIILLLNTVNTDVKLLKNTVLGMITKVENIECIENISSNAMQSMSDKAHDEAHPQQQVKPLLSVFPDQSSFQTHTHDSSKLPIQLQDINVPPEIQYKLNAMLNNKFTCIISKSPTDFGRTNLIEMDLPTTGPPVAMKPYIIPLKYKSFIDKEIKLLEDAGCISKSLSDWPSPICIMKKKPDPGQCHKPQLQMCIDYRKVNQSLITAHNNNNSKVVSTFPLPNTHKLLGRLNKYKYFSSLDLCSGYYHISLTEEAKKKMAFITADGKYQWNVVPFGLATTVSMFQYLMSTVLTGLNNFSFTYLDDVLVFSETYEEHLHCLSSVFKKFQRAGLKIKLSKCQFFKTRLHYLGHRISANGLVPLPEKLEVVKYLAPTRNVDEACQILGLLGYYRSFLPAFANITLPITSLLKKNTPFIWSEKCQLKVGYLKEVFCNRPILQFPDPNKTYILHTDASNSAYLGVLCQPISNDQDIRPVAYCSGTFTAQNRSWCATKQEAYAVLKSIQRFNYYLRGTKCTLHCGHKSLEPFLTRDMKIAKSDSWVMLLQEYDITFVHIRGKDNILADAISRLCTMNIYEKAIEDHHLPKAQATTHADEKVKHIQHLNSSTSSQLLNMNLQHCVTYKDKISFVKIKYKNYMQT